MIYELRMGDIDGIYKFVCIEYEEICPVWQFLGNLTRTRCVFMNQGGMHSCLPGDCKFKNSGRFPIIRSTKKVIEENNYGV